MSMIMSITYDCCYCGKERPQTVCHVMNSLLSSSKIFHGFDGIHHSLSFIAECPHCGFVSYYSTDKIPGVTYEDIMQINKEASAILASCPAHKRNDSIEIFVKYYLTLKRAKYEDTKKHLLEFAKCIYCLKDWCAIDDFVDEFLELYIQFGISDIKVLDLIRVLGRFSFVLEELNKIDCLENNREMIEIEKELCLKEIKSKITSSEVEQIIKNGIDKAFVRSCFFCGEELIYKPGEYVHTCKECNRTNTRYGEYHIMLHGSIPGTN